MSDNAPQPDFHESKSEQARLTENQNSVKQPTSARYEDLRTLLYGNSFAVESQPKDFVLYINEKGVNDILSSFEALIDAAVAEEREKILLVLPEPLFDWQPNPEEMHRNKYYRMGWNALLSHIKYTLRTTGNGQAEQKEEA